MDDDEDLASCGGTLRWLSPSPCLSSDLDTVPLLGLEANEDEAALLIR